MKSDPGSWSTIWREFSDNLAAGWSWSGFETSAFFVNRGGGDVAGRFVDLAPVLGADQVSDGRALATGDLDGDGDLDLLGSTANGRPLVYVLRNQAPRLGEPLILELVPSEHRSAAGALVQVTYRGRTLRRDVALGSGFAAQHELACHFGLGPAAAGELASVAITWPDGREDVLADVNPNQRLVVVQPDAAGDRVAVSRHAFAAPREPERLPAVEWDRERTALRVLRRPLPDLNELGLRDSQGNEISLAVGPAGREPGGPALLLNLWATWCSNCKREMPTLARAHDGSGAGLQVIGLCMDADSAESAQAAAQAWELPFPVAHATDEQQRELREALRGLHKSLAPADERPIPLPTTLVLTPGGKVAAMLEGAADIEAVRRFLRSRRGS